MDQVMNPQSREVVTVAQNPPHRLKVLILLTFLQTAFLSFHLVRVCLCKFFWKNIGAKAVRKMLVKLTAGGAPQNLTTPQQRKAFYIARELMTSERVFVDVLKLLNVEFREYLQVKYFFTSNSLKLRETIYILVNNHLYWLKNTVLQWKCCFVFPANM